MAHDDVEKIEGRIDDGFRTLYSFSLEPDVLLEEIDVTPPGIDGGGPVDTTTMRNAKWRTNQAKKLMTLTPSSANMAYNPAVIDQIVAMANRNQEITITYPDHSQLIFWGYINTSTPGALAEGARPQLAVNIQPTNQDSNGQEVDPVYLPPGGSP